MVNDNRRSSGPCGKVGQRQRFAPPLATIQIVGQHPESAKIDVDAPPVGGRTGRGRTARLTYPLHRLGGSDLMPERVTVPPIKTDGFELAAGKPRQENLLSPNAGR